MTAYAELQVTSNFSFLRGGSHPEELVLRAKELGLSALALTDRNTLAGVVRAHCAAKEVGIRFVVGARLDLAPERAAPTPLSTRDAVIPLRPSGSCFSSSSLARGPDPARATRGPMQPADPPLPNPPPQGGREESRPANTRLPPPRRGRPDGNLHPVRREGVLGEMQEDRIFPRPVSDDDGTEAPARSLLCFPTDRAAYGRLAQLISIGQRRTEKGRCELFFDDVIAHAQGQILIALPPEAPDDDFELFLKQLRANMGGPVYLAAQHLYRGDDAARIAWLAGLAESCGTPLVATGDVLYHAPERRPLQDVLTCIREHTTIDEAGYRLEANAERHLKSPHEMARLFGHYPQALARTREIVDACRFSLDELAYDYPIDPPPEGLSVQEHLERLTWEGAAGRYPDGVPDKVRKLLEHEFELIRELDYAPYFLTVYDLVRFARSKGILCQGRGSAANSAVCFCLGITAVDPGKFDLLFERFVSAERGEPPDIDVDFEHERREEVIQYVYDKYGREHAGIAATVIHYRSRSAIREVGKALGLSEDVVSALASSVWGWSEGGVEAKNAKERGLDPTEPRLAMALDLTRQLIGFPRHLSQHVGGFVLTRSRLDQVVPIANAAMAGRTVVEWDKDDLDALGILKIDVLALGMLTCVRKAFDLLQRHYGWRLDLATVPPEDPAVYEMLARADSLGVFQVESRAQMTMLPRLRPRCFYDLVIEVAIVRPGAIQGDMVHPYLRRRNGEEPVDYPSDELRGVLEKTLGVPLFQEQAMNIAIIGAGFSPSEADRLRRAMATFKRVGTIDRFGARFIEGMVENGYARDFAERCFKQIEGFGTYGFPESHAASFALLVYVSSWIKCHFPDVFAAALLNSQPMGFYAPAQIVRDAKDHGVAVLPVDVNASDWDNTLEVAAPPAEVTPSSDALASSSSPGSLSPSGSTRGPTLHDGRPRSADYMGPRIKSEDDRRRTSEDDTPSLSPPGETRGAILPDEGCRPAGGMGPRIKSEDDRKKTPEDDRRRTSEDEDTEADRATTGQGARSHLALRLGFRQVKGLKQAEMERLVARRGDGYVDLADLRRRAALGQRALDDLARADAFGSLTLDRRGAVWDAIGLDRTGHELDPPPLFAWAESRTAGAEPEVALPAMTLGHHVAEDYASLRLTLRAHPLALLRPRLGRRVIEAKELLHIDHGARVEVAGLALVRQRPGTASGVIFITIEDETGVANLVVWPRVFERFRKVVLGAQLMVVRGRVQKEGIVVHVVADELIDRSDLLRRLGDTEKPFAAPIAHADHAKSSGPPDPRDPGAKRREQQLLPGLHDAPALEAPVARADRLRPRRDDRRPSRRKAAPQDEPPFSGAMARADEVKRPARDLRDPPKRLDGFKSRDFH